MNKSMKRGVHRGLDYTPLFRFLLSKVGQEWDKVFSEAVTRLDTQEPIFWMVKIKDDPSDRSNNEDWFGTGEARYSKLFVDNNGILQKINPELKNEYFIPSCGCTHTFNGKVLINKYNVQTKKFIK